MSGNAKLNEKIQADTVPLKKKVLEWLWTGFMKTYVKVSYSVPLPFARFSGKLLARLVYHILPRRRRIAMENLDRAYGDTLTRKEKTAIVKSSFENFGIVAAEFSRLQDMNTARGQNYVRRVGAECIDHSQGGLIVAAHLSNWEWMAASLSHFGIEVAIVVNNYRDPERGDLIDDIRRSSGIETIPKKGAALKILRALRKGKLVGLLIDQSPRKDACEIEVFGHPCWATEAPAHLALRTGCPVYIAQMKREKDSTYTASITGPVEFEKTDDLAADVIAYTQQLQTAIESLIRENPEQWMWTHDRWKLRPELRK